MMSKTKDLKAVQEMCTIAKRVMGYDVLDLCLNGPDEKLNDTLYQQPALFLATLAALAKLQKDKPEAVSNCSAVAGFSLGEWSALVAAGVVSFEDGMKLVKWRAEAMDKAAMAVPGTLMTVIGTIDRQGAGMFDKAKLQLCADLATKESGSECMIAIEMFNCGWTVGGTMRTIEMMESFCKKKGALKTTVQFTNGAFHTVLMDGARQGLYDALAKVELKPPKCSLFLNATGRAIRPGTDPNDFKDLLVDQLTHTVLWADELTNMIEDGVTQFYEVGPGKQLKAIMKRVDEKMWKQVDNVQP
jgi:[acyl-carrier-protein] S-malonyltransferase